MICGIYCVNGQERTVENLIRCIVEGSPPAGFETLGGNLPRYRCRIILSLNSLTNIASTVLFSEHIQMPCSAYISVICALGHFGRRAVFVFRYYCRILCSLPKYGSCRLIWELYVLASAYIAAVLTERSPLECSVLQLRTSNVDVRSPMVWALLVNLQSVEISVQ